MLVGLQTLLSNYLLGIKNWPTRFPDVSYLVTREELDSVGTEATNYVLGYPRRYERDVIQIMEEADRIKEVSDWGSKRRLKRLLGSQSLEHLKLGALWKWYGTDIYQSQPTDTQHQDNNGMSKHLVDCLEDLIFDAAGESGATSAWATINIRFSSQRNLHGVNFASQGFQTAGLTSEDRRGLMKGLAVMLVEVRTHAGKLLVPKEVVRFFADYARWQQFRDMEDHSLEDLKHLVVWTARGQAANDDEGALWSV